jgi:hypothetical protein
MEEELRMTARREQKILDLKRKYLKSEEERRRLLERGQSRLIVESEPKDIKPIIHTDGVIEGGGKEESDDDDIVFVKEVKGKAPKAVGDISCKSCPTCRSDSPLTSRPRHRREYDIPPLIRLRSRTTLRHGRQSRHP